MAIVDWSDEYLDKMREVGDEEADAAVRVIMGSDDVAGVLAELMRTRDVLTAKLPPSLHGYFVDAARLPSWTLPDVVKAGEQLALEYGFTASTLLGCASLPECYIMRNGVHVLAYTNFLGAHTGRRVVQTAQMIMDVMRPGGLVPDSGIGVGVRAAIKVRLMHAVIRYLLLKSAKPALGPPRTAAQVFETQVWNPALGRPINQEDLAYTLLTFSHVPLRALQQMVKLSGAQKDAYIHCWNVVGHLMGVREELLPQGHDEAEILFQIIKRRQQGESDAGKKLMAALMTLMTDIMPHGLKHVPHILVHQYVGAETAAMLGVEPLGLVEELARKAIHAEWGRIDGRLEHLYEAHPFAALASTWLHEKILEHWGKLHPDGRFDFPAEASDWVLPKLESLAVPPRPADRSAPQPPSEAT